MPDRQPKRWGNVTVPYTAMWSTEIERREPRVVYERWCGQRLAMLSEGIHACEGKPVFKMLHADRCREVIRQEICQMCLRRLPDRVVTVNQGQEDRFRPLINDGLPMCPGCALDALVACPGMQRQQEAGTLRLWLSRRGEWLLAPVLLGPVRVMDGGDERINAMLHRTAQQVFTGPKLVLTGWRRVAAADLAEIGVSK